MKKIVPDQDEINDLVQDCSNSIANALELLQSCAKPSRWQWIRCFSSGMLLVFTQILRIFSDDYDLSFESIYFSLLENFTVVMFI